MVTAEERRYGPTTTRLPDLTWPDQDSAPAHAACKTVEFLNCEMPDFMPPCCLVLIRWILFIREPDKVDHRSWVATDSTSWDQQACTHGTVWRQRYITTSKKYLTNSHTLLKHCELVFLLLHLLIISCKLITIRLSYKIQKKGAFLMKHCVYYVAIHLELWNLNLTPTFDLLS